MTQLYTYKFFFHLYNATTCRCRYIGHSMYFLAIVVCRGFDLRPTRKNPMLNANLYPNSVSFKTYWQEPYADCCIQHYLSQTVVYSNTLCKPRHITIDVCLRKIIHVILNLNSYCTRNNHECNHMNNYLYFECTVFGDCISLIIAPSA